MSITIETKLTDPKALTFIDAMGELFGRLERKLFVDSYIRDLPLNLQAMFAPKAPEVTTSSLRGAIGIDLNADHIAYVETDRFGNPIQGGSLPFEQKGKSSGQVTAQLSDHIAELVDQAKLAGKVIVCEKLDFAKKKEALRETATKGKRTMLSAFAYKKFHNLLSGRCQSQGVRLKSENPAFTSVIGFYKFHGYTNYTSHELAALSIARRGLGFSERPKTKYASVETEGILGVDDPATFFTESRTKHVWSYYARNAKEIREVVSSQSSGRLKPSAYPPHRPSGYAAMEALRHSTKISDSRARGKPPPRPGRLSSGNESNVFLV